MATTAIWPVKGYLGRVVLYIENPEKTENPRIYDKPNMTKDECQSLSDVIDYAADGEKTAKKYFVSGVNCIPDTARDEMLMIKKLYGKEGGRVGYHGYQSFAPGEVMPALAHEIGIQLAKKLWGDDFQVIVATHLDHEGHIHNHFVLNSVARSDGHRYHNSKSDYRKMREVSDRLCEAYGLSVIRESPGGKSKAYAQWRAEKNGAPTWHSLIKADIDEAIRVSMTDTQFYSELKRRGYEVKIGKDISVRPQGKARFFRLARNLGSRYTRDEIISRILSNRTPKRHAGQRLLSKRRHPHILFSLTRRKISGLMGLYLYYKFLLKRFSRNGHRHGNRCLVASADCLMLDRISEETRLLFKNRIETIVQLDAFKSKRQSEISMLTKDREVLKKRIKKETKEEIKADMQKEITEVGASLRKLRREIRLADDIAVRSYRIRENLSKETPAKEAPAKKAAAKEEVKDELFRRSR